jgi:hypothetical protein
LIYITSTIWWGEKLAVSLTGLLTGEVDADGLRFLLEAVGGHAVA